MQTQEEKNLLTRLWRVLVKHLAAVRSRLGRNAAAEKRANPVRPCYGYRNAPELESDGKRETGVRLEIVPEEAEAVRRIFELHASGLSIPRTTDAPQE